MLAIKRTTAAGFTLIEIMVVVVIIGMLSGLVGVNVFNRLKKANIQATKTQIYNLSQALDNYKLDNHAYPSSEMGLDALINKPSNVGNTYASGGYLQQKKLPNDAWGQEYNFVSPGVHNTDSFDLWSKGPDREDGTDDDISNWEGTSEEKPES
jgi:general secretion pathway protein G